MNEHIEYLQRLGLTEYQARAMFVLFAKKEINAEDICRFSGIPQTKIYQVMRTLIDKGIVECTISKPRIYRCGEPTEVLNALIQKFMKRVECLKEAKREQLRKMKGIELQAVEKEKVHPELTDGIQIEA